MNDGIRLSKRVSKLYREHPDKDEADDLFARAHMSVDVYLERLKFIREQCRTQAETDMMYLSDEQIDADDDLRSYRRPA